jgi:phenylacetate-CoA ligase
MLATHELIRQSNQQLLLESALPRSLAEAPLYRDAARLFEPWQEPAAALQRLPFITKQDIRWNFPHNFLKPGANLETLLERDLVEVEHTSGSGSERTPLLLGQGWWAEQEERALRLNDLVARVLDENPAARRVNLSSPTCNNDICYHGVPPLTDRLLGNTLVASLSRQPFLWGERDWDRITAETQEWQPRFLDVDPAYGVALARHCERRGIRFPSLQFILCSYEYLSVVHRSLLRRAFQVPVFNLYGATETGHLLMENEAGEMIPSLETAFLEMIAADHQGIGELVVTTLTNEYMPLIRYRIGDLVQRQLGGHHTAFQVHGRLTDALVPSDGQRRTVRQVDDCFAAGNGICHYQLRQEDARHFVLWYIPDGPGPDAVTAEALKARLGATLGSGTRISFRATDALLAEPSGKFRLTLPRGR